MVWADFDRISSSELGEKKAVWQVSTMPDIVSRRVAYRSLITHDRSTMPLVAGKLV
jgi:hypothetical protein